MTLLEQIEKQLSLLPPEKQEEVMDFIASLQRKEGLATPVKGASLKEHTAFGLWKHRKVDGLKYQRDLRSEWHG